MAPPKPARRSGIPGLETLSPTNLRTGDHTEYLIGCSAAGTPLVVRLDRIVDAVPARIRQHQTPAVAQTWLEIITTRSHLP